MPKSKRDSVKRRYNKSLSFGKTKRGAGKGTIFKSREENPRDASELFAPITIKEPVKITTTRISSLNFPEDESEFDKVEQEKEQINMTKADREAQEVEFDELMNTAKNIPLMDDDCPEGIGCTIMGGIKSRRKRRKGRKTRKHRKSRR